MYECWGSCNISVELSRTKPAGDSLKQVSVCSEVEENSTKERKEKKKRQLTSQHYENTHVVNEI